eukprot:GHVR01015281.1.p1 GENE.GHVR01015281.1~~GHVR01015281.1.p1  ORF type:complete len:155 (-),score=37.01 GHVR01015281.1:381-845(-)
MRINMTFSLLARLSIFCVRPPTWLIALMNKLTSTLTHYTYTHKKTHTQVHSTRHTHMHCRLPYLQEFKDTNDSNKFKKLKEEYEKNDLHTLSPNYCIDGWKTKGGVQTDSMNFFKSMLDNDPDQRPSADAVLKKLGWTKEEVACKFTHTHCPNN